jgi:hypothetical protein
MSKKAIPPYIYCPKCGQIIELILETNPETIRKMAEQGYTATAKGICECGVVAILCYQPLPASPTFSLFFDIYQKDAIKETFLNRKREMIV